MKTVSISKSTGTLALPRLPQNNRQLGALFEHISCKYLEHHGYVLLKKNWRCAAGEIDLIFQIPHTKTYVLVEVKARKFEGHHSIQSAVDYAKRAQLYRVAEIYARPLLRSDKESRFRIDTIRIVYLHEHGTLQFRLEHIAAAIHHAFTFEKNSWGQNRPLRQTKALFRKSYSS